MKPLININENKCNFNVVRLFGVICFVFIIFSPVSLFAKTLTEYKKNIGEARDLIIVLLYPDEEDATPEISPKFAREALKRIRRSVPAREKIEWQDRSVETDNQWLFDALDEFEKEPGGSPKKEAILTSIGERLDALRQKIEELEKPPSANRAGAEDAQKLAEILRREEYQKPEKRDESFFQKLYRQIQEIYQKILDWLESFFPRPNLSAGSTNGFQSLFFILQMMLYALVLGVIAFLLYKFAPLLINRFDWLEKTDKNERVILGERLLPEQSSKSLFEEAEKLAREGDLRGAIRKGYIALLCDLADRKIIGLAQNKTNRDYLRDVRSKSELYQNLNGLTINFERHWYGFEPAEEKDWENFRIEFQKAINTRR